MPCFRCWISILLPLLDHQRLGHAYDAPGAGSHLATGGSPALHALLLKHAFERRLRPPPLATSVQSAAAPPYQPTMMLQAQSAANHRSSAAEARAQPLKLPDINDVFTKALAEVETLRFDSAAPLPVPAPAAAKEKWPSLNYESVGDSQTRAPAAPVVPAAPAAPAARAVQSARPAPPAPGSPRDSAAAAARADAATREVAEAMLGAAGASRALGAGHAPVSLAAETKMDAATEAELRREAQEMFGLDGNGNQDMSPLPDFSGQLSMGEQAPQSAQSDPAADAVAEAAAAVAAIRSGAQAQLQRQRKPVEPNPQAASSVQAERQGGIIIGEDAPKREAAFPGEDAPRTSQPISPEQPQQDTQAAALVAEESRQGPPPVQPTISAIPALDVQVNTGWSHWRCITVLAIGVVGFAIAGWASDCSRGYGIKKQLCGLLLQAQALVCSLSESSLSFASGPAPMPAAMGHEEMGSALAQHAQQAGGCQQGVGAQGHHLFGPPGGAPPAPAPDAKMQPMAKFVPAHPTKLLRHAGLPSDDTKLIIPLAPLRLLEWSVEILGPHGVPLLHAQLRQHRCPGSSRKIEVATLGVVGTTLAAATDDFQLTSMGGVPYGQILQEAARGPATAKCNRRCEVRGAAGGDAAMLLEFDECFWLESVTLPATGALLASVARRRASTLIHGEHIELSTSFGVDSSLLLAIVLAVTTFGLPRCTEPRSLALGAADLPKPAPGAAATAVHQAQPSLPVEQAAGVEAILAAAPPSLSPRPTAAAEVAFPDATTARAPEMPARASAFPTSTLCPGPPTPRSIVASQLATQAVASQPPSQPVATPPNAPAAPPAAPPMPVFRPAPIPRAP